MGLCCVLQGIVRGHGGRVVTLSRPTSEAGVRFPAQPQVGKLVVDSLQYRTLMNCMYWFPLPLPTTHRDMTCTVLKTM